MKWITREHVKVDRVACPWLIRCFIDKDVSFTTCRTLERHHLSGVWGGMHLPD
ncbi:chromate resistance protein [Geomonas subterranea]|uniref:Chromate resistance protein n=1 Tax=Geomonas subterranea TaxID=2847989 RepID=A0ABX8LNQ7_9BACT|nr:chromate resistance protein [Geomonas subterranea]QXM09636.1 chromate resistance protein [Geomonas subterranea]